MAKVPLTLLTGFLGSGKTTLLNSLLKTPELADTAVLINEFGEIALDHHLVETATDSAVVLDNGCICCTMRGALSGALRSLFWQRNDKKIPHFKRVIIETTGLADPAPILHELLNHPTILQHYRLAGVIVCVDGVFGSEQLDQHIEAVKQAAVADRLLITKTDLVAADQVDMLVARLHALNPGADISRIAGGSCDPQMILEAIAYDPFSKNLDVQQWLKAEAYRRVQVRPGLGLSRKAMPMAQDVNRHGDHIQAFCIAFDRPLPWNGLITALEMLTAVRGEQLLRIKGIVDAEGQDKPRVIHGVQHMLFPATTLERWPDGQRESKLVFIVRGLDAEFIARTLGHFINAEAGDGQEEIDSSP